MAIVIVRPGMLGMIQDLGRFGYQRYGVVAGGAVDLSAARTANIMVGNEESAAVLEFVLAGAELRFDSEQLIAVCGGDMEPELDGEPLPQWRPVLARAGAMLRFRSVRKGCRAYVAAAGGFAAPLALGSRSTYARAGIGGVDGRALRAGDSLEVYPLAAGSLPKRMLDAFRSGVTAANWHAGHFAVAEEGDAAIVRMMPGTHYDWLTDEAKEALFSEPFRISVQSDRMGSRLEGSRLELNPQLAHELLSEAVSSGTVQLPPDGMPIVLLADRQPTGGYPRIAQAAAVDIPVFAQLKPGDYLFFEAITLQQAQHLLLESEKDMQLLKASIALKFR